jgi:hypothetical protein
MAHRNAAGRWRVELLLFGRLRSGSYAVERRALFPNGCRPVGEVSSWPEGTLTG